MFEIYNKINEAISTNRTAFVITIFKIFGSTPSHVGAKMLLYDNGDSTGTIGGGNLEQIIKLKILKKLPDSLQVWDIDLDTEAKMACGGRVSLIVEPILSKDKLYIIGGGHCAVQLSELAAKGGFNVTVIDNRSEWANPEKHFLAKTVTSPYDKIEQHIVFSNNTYIVIMTHQHKYDLLAAEKLVLKKYRYLGMIGSKNKAAKTFTRMRELNIPENIIKKIHTPIGLSINSETPFEIAVSIMAELIKERKKS